MKLFQVSTVYLKLFQFNLFFHQVYLILFLF
nr:MAG TPA: hypothetical protein [Caudoviricetes sp.]DAM75530.1 MAG TPA: hypothetical protein [Caudoviricetes sp.]